MKDLQKIFNIRVTTRACSNKVVEDSGFIHIFTTCVPENGKANQAVIDLLSKYLDIPKSRITILKGLKSRNKIVSIE